MPNYSSPPLNMVASLKITKKFISKIIRIMGMHSLFDNFLSNFLIILRPWADPIIGVLSSYLGAKKDKNFFHNCKVFRKIISPTLGDCGQLAFN